MPTYGVQVRVQRVTVEDAFVEVHLEEDMWVTKPDGGHGINVPLMWERALQIASQPHIEWLVEQQEIKHHEWQTPLPEERKLQ
jgi:hypothetical protein